MFGNVCKQNISDISRAHIWKSKRRFNVKSSAYHFHMKTKILADFQTCISVPWKNEEMMYCSKVVKLSWLYSVCCLMSYVVGHMFKGVPWRNVNNTNTMSRRNIRNLSLAYSDICVGFWYEVIGKIHIQNLSKHLRWFLRLQGFCSLS